MVEYRGYLLRVQLREWAPGFMANLDLMLSDNGLAIRRWWPVPHMVAGQVYASSDDAQAAALRFGHTFVDNLHTRGA
jgi:hypothetical protein